MKAFQHKLFAIPITLTVGTGALILFGHKAVPLWIQAGLFAASGVVIAVSLRELLTKRLAVVEESLTRSKQVYYERHFPFAAGDEFDFIDKSAQEMIEQLREVRKQVQETKTEVTDLVSLGEILNESRNRGQVVTRIIDESLKRVEADSAALLLFNESRGELMVEATRGAGSPFRPGEFIPATNPLFAQVERERRPIILGSGVRSRLGGIEASDEGKCACVPLVVERDIIGMLTVGDKRDGATFSSRDIEVLSYLGNAAALVLENSTLQRQLTEVFLKVVGALATAVDQRDTYTGMHSRRVEEYAVALGRARGLTPAEMDTLQFGAILHDIGKIGIPESILQKPGRLTAEEFEHIKSHPVRGETILKSITLPWPVLPIIRSHHERWGGGGYPDNLRGEAIHSLARLVTLADVFDAITSNRAYRDAMLLEQALAEIRRGTNNLFDPRLVATAIEVLRAEYPRVNEING